MTTIKRVEEQIRSREGFRVAIHFSGPGGKRGKDVRSDKTGLTGYHYARRLYDGKNVSDWIAGRFNKNFPGYSVQVFDGDGKPAHGRTLLKNVRATYEK